MAINAEKKLAKLENEIKALKATYSVYGGLVKSYLKTYTWTNTSNLRVSFSLKFTPDYGEGNTMIFGFYYNVTRNGIDEMLDDGYISIQDGSGNVVFNISGVMPNSTLNVMILTPVPGTLTKI